MKEPEPGPGPELPLAGLLGTMWMVLGLFLFVMTIPFIMAPENMLLKLMRVGQFRANALVPLGFSSSPQTIRFRFRFGSRSRSRSSAASAATALDPLGSKSRP